MIAVEHHDDPDFTRRGKGEVRSEAIVTTAVPDDLFPVDVGQEPTDRDMLSLGTYLGSRLPQDVVRG